MKMRTRVSLTALTVVIGIMPLMACSSGGQGEAQGGTGEGAAPAPKPGEKVKLKWSDLGQSGGAGTFSGIYEGFQRQASEHRSRAHPDPE
ncbi:hypothetical protein ACHHV8_32135 [Paenibacillus sp. TAB 01]|uniref:hypothetical protein n=1 Tax=Paenibacillus sp. TAB 01 TaxID=3368988 RepID=UPI003751701F